MNKMTMDINSALEEIDKLPYAYIRCLSNVYIGKNPKSLSLDELIEARFFDETEEIRLFYRQGELSAARVTEAADTEIIREDYKISNIKFGKELSLIRQLAVDDDGQCYVSATRLAGWKGETENG